MKTIMRILEVELNNFKNIEHGIISVQSGKKNDEDVFSKKAEVLGIYGQNGSGKTSVVDAIEIIQRLMSGQSIKYYSLINLMDIQSKESDIKIRFSVDGDDLKGILEYSVGFKKKGDDFEIYTEELQMKDFVDGKFTRIRSILRYTGDENRIYPNKTNSYFKNMAVDLAVCKEIAKKDLVSFIFGDYGINLFMGDKHSYSKLKDIVASLSQYSKTDLIVINNKKNGYISGTILVPFSMKLSDMQNPSLGEIPVLLNGATNVPIKVYKSMKSLVENMNTVLGKIIPNLSIEVVDLGKEILKDGTEGTRITLVSSRDGVRVPLRYESSGVIKIVSMLNILIHVYNDPAMSLVIDEFDSGIYEFLLGELLTEFEKNARGQLIFTSHNLRALEMLNKDCIVFSTTNKSNRFIRFKNIKNNHNLRDTYLRSILLGGQDEGIYDETNSVLIGRAFRKAWKGMESSREYLEGKE